MVTFEQLRALRTELIALASKHKAENIRVFGSVARGEENENSDVDILVHFREDASLFDLMDLQEDTERMLGIDVDVISDRGLSPYLETRILGEARPL